MSTRGVDELYEMVVPPKLLDHEAVNMGTGQEPIYESVIVKIPLGNCLEGFELQTILSGTVIVSVYKVIV